MINITKKQMDSLRPLIPDLDILINKETDEELLLAIDDLIIDELDDDQDELSEKGVRLQLLYDEIFAQND